MHLSTLLLLVASLHSVVTPSVTTRPLLQTLRLVAVWLRFIVGTGAAIVLSLLLMLLTVAAGASAATAAASV